MSYGRAFGLSLFAASVAVSSAQQYSLVGDFRGSNFFSGFRFNESAIDTNNFGNVHFLSQSAANSAGLTFVDANQHAIIKIDNTTSGAGDPSFGRNSVYLLSNDPLQIGSVLIADVNHIPFGCSVWPGLFTQGANWPAQGEIDIVENVNQATLNQYSLHVGQTCNQPASAASQQSGKTTGTNCTVVPSLDINTGCIVQEQKQNSFGSGFASAGGGIYAMQWDTQGVSTWFFPRGQEPSDISASNNNPDPTKWGMPSALYPASDCDPTKVFGPQFITLYINVCGAFAGEANVFQSTCGSVAPNCTSLVADPANYNTAYWDINYIRTFSTNPPSSSAGSSGSPTSGSPSSPTNSGSNNSGSGSGSGAISAFSSVKETLLVPVAAMVFGLFAMI